MGQQPPELSEGERRFALLFAMVIRNAMEDFHCKHLTDEQMKELNPIIRNAVCTALHAFNHYEQSAQAKKFVDFQFKCMPKYWEPPDLMENYRRLWERDSQVDAG